MQTSEMYGPPLHVNHVKVMLARNVAKARARINTFRDVVNGKRNNPEAEITVKKGTETIRAGDVSSFAHNMTMFSDLPGVLKAQYRMAISDTLLYLIEEETAAKKTSEEIMEVLLNRLTLGLRQSLTYHGIDPTDWSRFVRNIEALVYSDLLVELSNGRYPYS